MAALTLVSADSSGVVCDAPDGSRHRLPWWLLRRAASRANDVAPETRAAYADLLRAAEAASPRATPAIWQDHGPAERLSRGVGRPCGICGAGARWARRRFGRDSFGGDLYACDDVGAPHGEGDCADDPRHVPSITLGGA